MFKIRSASIKKVNGITIIENLNKKPLDLKFKLVKKNHIGKPIWTR